MEPPAPPYDDYPFYGRYSSDHAHAPFVIVNSLIQLGLSEWSGTLLHWLGHYDGLEEHLSSDGNYPDYRLDPVLSVRDVLIKHAGSCSSSQRLSTAQQRERIESIVDDLLKLEFVNTHACWGTNHPDVWRPLTDHWLAFIERGPDLYALRQMEDDVDGQWLLNVMIRTTAPDRESIRKTLLGDLYS
jgi:hypothetical protein